LTQARIEKRMRLRRRSDVQKGTAKMNPKAIKYLKIENELEAVVAGKKKLRFRVLAWDETPENEVWCNEEELQMHGVADRTIATCRAPLNK